jgi:hypothetical protein
MLDELVLEWLERVRKVAPLPDLMSEKERLILLEQAREKYMKYSLPELLVIRPHFSEIVAFYRENLQGLRDYVVNQVGGRVDTNEEDVDHATWTINNANAFAKYGVVWDAVSEQIQFHEDEASGRFGNREIIEEQIANPNSVKRDHAKDEKHQTRKLWRKGIKAACVSIDKELGRRNMTQVEACRRFLSRYVIVDHEGLSESALANRFTKYKAFTRPLKRRPKQKPRSREFT